MVLTCSEDKAGTIMRPSPIAYKLFDGRSIPLVQIQTRPRKNTMGINWFYFFSLVFAVLLVNSSTVSGESKGTITRAANLNTRSNDKNTGTEVKVTSTSNPPFEKITVTGAIEATLKAKESHHMNCSNPANRNNTICKEGNDGVVNYFLKKMSSNSGMLFRTMYVLLAVTGIVIIYFIIKAVRLRRRRSKSQKYGIIAKQGDRGDMEMEPLGDGNDEDDDYTVFEMGRRK